MSLSSLARASTSSSSESHSSLVSCLVLNVIAEVVSGHLTHFLGSELSLLVLSLTVSFLLPPVGRQILQLLLLVLVRRIQALRGLGRGRPWLTNPVVILRCLLGDCSSWLRGLELRLLLMG